MYTLGGPSCTIDRPSRPIIHDDLIKWKHFPRYWPFVWGIHGSSVNSPHKGQWRGALMFSLISTWMNGWINNHEAGDLRRHQAHYGVFVMIQYSQVPLYHTTFIIRLYWSILGLKSRDTLNGYLCHVWVFLANLPCFNRTALNSVLVLYCINVRYKEMVVQNKWCPHEKTYCNTIMLGLDSSICGKIIVDIHQVYQPTFSSTPNVRLRDN